MPTGEPQCENPRKYNERHVSRSYQRTKKATEDAGDGDTNCNRCTWNDPERIGNESGKLEIRGQKKSTRILRSVLETCCH